MKSPSIFRPITGLVYVIAFLTTSAIAQSTTSSYRFDFGPSPAARNYMSVQSDTDFTNAAGFGWIAPKPDLQQRTRNTTDTVLRDFVMGELPATFRVVLSPGDYTAEAVMGDTDFGDHVLLIKSPAGGAFPKVTAKTGEFTTLRWPVIIPATNQETSVPLDLQFSTAGKNWIVNSITLTPGTTITTPAITKVRISSDMSRPVNPSSLWADVASWPDPTKPLVAQFLKDQKTATIEPTGHTRLDYIKLAADNVDFWKQHQNADGAIIDPYRKQEFQYSTPCFALAGAAAIEYLDRDDLLETTAKAMDWSCLTLSEGRAASNHGDFFAPVIAHALPLLKRYVPAERYARWEKLISAFDPYDVYRFKPGGGNWNVVAMSGEYLFHKMGLRKDMAFVEDSVAGQGKHFHSLFGLYVEGPMAYDHFPRLWAADMVANGYEGKDAKPLGEVLRRAALTSMFIQSPTGELPLGHRSAHHQWNEAEQCVTYEIYGAAAARNKQPELAGAYKRAARLALASIKRWQRPSGELWIVKNKVDPARFHGFEGYSGHSQYNLLPMAMLVMAHAHSSATETIKEMPAPADVGGFVVHLEKLHKIIANAGGAYLEIETNADRKYDATGLVRVHFKGQDPQLGPSDILTSSSNYTLPKVERTTAAIGPTWQGSNGQWRSLAQMGGTDITKVELTNIEASPESVKFQVAYHGKFDGPQTIIQRFDVTPQKNRFTTILHGYTNSSRLEWPVFADNGLKKTDISVNGKTVSVRLENSTQTFQVPHADRLTVPEQNYPNRNGWARLARAEYNADSNHKLSSQSAQMTLEISPGE